MRKRQRGMTLLEIMIVLAIIALVMGLVVGPKIMDHYRDSQRNVAKLAVHKYADEEYPQWAVTHPSQTCPKSLAELGRGGTTTAIDPWGTEYHQHCGDTAPPGDIGFGASSSARDRVADTDDDIRSWD